MQEKNLKKVTAFYSATTESAMTDKKYVHIYSSNLKAPSVVLHKWSDFH